MKIVDNSGIWYVNRAQFAMVDGESGVRFEPNEPTKVKPTDWVKSQPTMEVCADPTVEVTEKLQSKIDQANEQAETERLAKQEAADVAQAAARGEAPPAPPAPPTPTPTDAPAK